MDDRTDDAAPPMGTGARLELNSPLAPASLERLIVAATRHRPSVVIDHGCGWGTSLLEALRLCPDARGRGVEVHPPDLARARDLACELELSERVEWVEGSSADDPTTADLLISIGAYQAFGSPGEALSALRTRLNPGGRLLFGLEYWQAPPTEQELTQMWQGACADDCLSLPEVIATAHEGGWRVLDLHDSTRTEFDAFEVGHLREREEWLLQHDDATVRTEQDRAWQSWLQGHRRPMGFVTLLLG